ncbi:hypothetical protein DPEC_G00222870 [Dallia pectoralis]|uniref:Uncharacterized protein n=1 Tax=Dallia pectoralis TaxID=75939 RepID=A0ACC2G000_DALPE|nr:hypothetical protein DPEC_G00222870 [Dallia pectoralis]
MVPRNRKGTDTTSHASVSGGKYAPKYAQTKHTRGNKDFIKVLAERNQSVAPVGVWVESEPAHYHQDEHPEVRALLTEELQAGIQMEKEDSLRRFQEKVRHRVAQQAQLLKMRQLQKSYEVADRERRVLQQSSDTAQRLTQRKSRLPCSLQGELGICSPKSHWNQAQAHKSQNVETNTTDQQTHQLSEVMKRVRHKLAACQTDRDAEVMSELPGWKWKVSPPRDLSDVKQKPVPSRSRVDKEKGKEEEEADIPLIEQHDSSHLGPFQGLETKTVTFNNTPVCDVVLRGRTGHGVGISSDYRSTQVLWPDEDQEELKRQRQSQFLLYRRQFMDIEREQVKEHQRHRKHLRRIARIKAEKEQMRSEEETAAARGRENADGLKKKERARKDKEASRYIEALRAQMKEKMAIEKTELPPLCSCGDSFWDSHPDTCANNCVFYSNHKAYVQALQSTLLSCDLRNGSHSTHHRVSARRIASLHALSPRK